MEICIVTPKAVKGDGQGRANYEIISYAITKGHQVTVVTSQIASELEKNPLVTWIPVTVEKFPSNLIRELIFSWKSASWLNRHRTKFDLIQVYGCVTSTKGDINTVQFVHSAWLKSPVHISKIQKNLYGFYQWIYTFLGAYWEKQAFAKAECIVAVSQRVKQELLDIGVFPNKIQVIFNGVDTEEFVPGSMDRKKLDLPENVCLAMFTGDIRTNRKNLDTVLKALVNVPDLHLAVVGNTQNSPYLQMAKDLGLNQRVHFLGYRLDVAKIMQAVDMFIFPSRYEPFGMVVSEAMATGLPVVTAKTTGASEIVTPECGIVLSDSEDVSELTEALKKLDGDRHLRQEMGKAGRFIAQKHSWESKAEQYLELFEKFAANEN